MAKFDLNIVPERNSVSAYRVSEDGQRYAGKPLVTYVSPRPLDQEAEESWVSAEGLDLSALAIDERLAVREVLLTLGIEA